MNEKEIHKKWKKIMRGITLEDSIRCEGYYEDLQIRKYRVDLGIIKEEPLQPIMDGFDGILKLLHESTHDKEVRKSILIVQKYKTTYLDKKS